MEQNQQCPPQSNDVFSPGPSGVAALLAIFLGSLGIQYFYLGKNTAGVIALVLSIITCGIPWILWLIQGIMMFTMSQADFERKFVYSTSTFPLF